MFRLPVPPRAEQFRSDFRQWLAADGVAPPADGETDLETFIRAGRSWQQKLAAARWVAVHWPVAYGGRGLSLVEEAVAQEELGRIGAPQVLGLFGLTMVGPVLIAHGTEAQKQRYLAKILTAEEIWCQGFSEPGAGSDLTAIATKCRPVEDPERGSGFLVSGSKIWTSFAQIADWCFLLGRSSQEAKPHQGLSYLLVDMKSAGITVRPLRQISGDDEFNEVFFDDVFVPRSQLVGQMGEGWKIALSTLMYERVVLTFSRHIQSERVLRDLLRLAEDGELVADERRRLSDCIATFSAVRALAYKHLYSYANGAVPGPEGSMDKLCWSESFQELSQLALSISSRITAHGALPHPWLRIAAADHRYLYSRGRTIAAGTSEIQRTIIAERILGLPRLKTTASER